MSVKKHPLYRRFSSIKTRCLNKKAPDYARYGAKGIKLKWLSFEEFARDMYPSFKKHATKHGVSRTTLERINNAGHYSKENCRWATPEEQAQNRYTNRFITFRGLTLTIASWSRRVGVSRQMLRYRLNQGWPTDRVLCEPINHGNGWKKYAHSI